MRETTIFDMKIGDEFVLNGERYRLKRFFNRRMMGRKRSNLHAETIRLSDGVEQWFTKPVSVTLLTDRNSN